MNNQLRFPQRLSREERLGGLPQIAPWWPNDAASIWLDSPYNHFVASCTGMRAYNLIKPRLILMASSTRFMVATSTFPNRFMSRWRSTVRT